jgi:C4-dicarboxylate transporter DctQ subunit
LKDKKNNKLIYILNHFEAYIAAALFIVICALMFVQVFTRYVFNSAITWTEELSTAMFVVLIYCAIAAAVTERKHIGIDILLTVVSFKTKKVLMILGNCVFIAFCIYVIKPFFKVIDALGASRTMLLHIPKKIIYITIPILLVLTCIRIIQDTIRILHEDEENLGKSVPVIDLDQYEREYLENQKAIQEEKGEQEK